MSIGERCKQAREKLGMSQEKLASIIKKGGFKIAQSTINNLEAGDVKRPRYVPELAKALGVSTEWLLYGTEPKVAQETVTPSALRVAPISVPTLDSMPRDVPVLGTATGGNGQVVMRGEAIDYVRRPPSLNGRTDIFALYVEDVSMQPAFNPGDLVLVEKRRPRVGDHAIIEFQDGPRDEVRVIIKRLSAVTGTVLKLEQYNPAKVIEVKMQNVITMQRVMTLADLFIV